MQRRFITLALILLFGVLLHAQEQDTAKPTIEDLQLQIQAMSDSLLRFREQEIYSEYGFRDTDKLQDVTAKLEIENLVAWKNYLGIEPDNEVLDRMSLRRLGITPYRALLAQQYSIYGFTELSTLSELAQQKHLPLKKLRQFAGLPSNTKQYDNYSLQALGKTPQELDDFSTEFDQNRLNFGFTITAVGILIVFSALALTAIVISQLRHLNRKPKAGRSALVLSPKGAVISHPQDMNSDVIAAAITALHLYQHDIQERRRLLLTFRRSGADLWHGSAVLNMPNRHILRKRS